MAAGSFLTDAEIASFATQGRPLVDPMVSDDIQPATIDLRLNGEQTAYTFESYRLGDDIPEASCTRSSFTELTLAPQATVHVGHEGVVNIPDNMVGFIFARSSLTRLGLRIAPIFLNPGYSGTLPLTVTNAAAFPITLVKGVRFVQLLCFQLTSTPQRAYQARNGKYAGEHVYFSKIHTDEDIKAALEKVLSGYFPPEVAKTLA